MAHLKSNFRTLKCFPTLSIFLLFLIICFLPDDTHGDEIETGYMLRLMKALTPTPSNWSNNTHICNWIGVSCAYHYIDRIDLSSMSLTGILPSGLNESLSFLTRLNFYNNSLSGPLPSLANLGNLQRAYLSDNNFTSIPEGCFQGLIGLQILLLGNNVNLKPWKFPTELTDSSALARLDLSVTNLVGSLPDIFHSFPNLQILDLSMNDFSGVLPQSFAQSKIHYLALNDQSHDKLSSTIEILSSMTNLNVVRLQGNRFEGPIPDLSNCTHLETLCLQDNQLTGAVPPSLMSLSSLEDFSLDNNWLQGPFPVFNKQLYVTFEVNNTNGFCLDHAGPCDRRVTTLLEIDAGFGYPLLLARSWRGNNPCKGWRFIVCDGGKIRTVNLTKLNLTGTISPAFGNLTDLRHLYLAGNDLRGSIPESLATLPLLEVVDVSDNNLSGNIPRFSHKVKFTATGNAFLRHSQANRATPWIAGASAVGAGVIVISLVIIYYRKRCLTLLQNMMLKKTRTCVDQNVENFIKNYGFLSPKRYNFSEVKKMTNSFRDKLGQGGYGTVFKATLTDSRQVAVKVLNDSKGSGEEFINEVASISRTSHMNIVSLLGFCYEMNKRALIYEFMPNGSLDKFLYEKGSPEAIHDLDWNTLYKIVIGIARGLEYLHQGCSTRILHLDIKPQNILLDEDFCPKISDFGLAKICRKKESIVSILGPRGTIGYIAPEVYSRIYGGVSHKSDVYSYGMLILDLVGGRKNYYSGDSHYSDEMYFPDWIYKDLEQGNTPTRCLANTEEEKDMVMKIILVSLWCIQQNPLERPSMNKVVEMLEGSLQSVPHPPKPVWCSPERSPLQFSSISYGSIHDTYSINS